MIIPSLDRACLLYVCSATCIVVGSVFVGGLRGMGFALVLIGVITGAATLVVKLNRWICYDE